MVCESQVSREICMITFHAQKQGSWTYMLNQFTDDSIVEVVNVSPFDALIV